MKIIVTEKELFDYFNWFLKIAEEWGEDPITHMEGSEIIEHFSDETELCNRDWFIEYHNGDNKSIVKDYIYSIKDFKDSPQ